MRKKCVFFFESVHLEGSLIQEASHSATLIQRATSWRNKEMFVSIKNVSNPKLYVIKNGPADEIIRDYLMAFWLSPKVSTRDPIISREL